MITLQKLQLVKVMMITHMDVYQIIADPKAMQQINFTGNLTRGKGARMCFIIEEAKEAVLDFSRGPNKVL